MSNWRHWVIRRATERSVSKGEELFGRQSTEYPVPSPHTCCLDVGIDMSREHEWFWEVSKVLLQSRGKVVRVVALLGYNALQAHFPQLLDQLLHSHLVARLTEETLHRGERHHVCDELNEHHLPICGHGNTKLEGGMDRRSICVGEGVNSLQ